MTRRPDNQFLNRTNIARTNQLVRGLAIGSLVAISAFALLYTPVRSSLTQALFSVAPIVWGVSDAAGNVLNSFVTNFRDKRILVAENAILTESIDRMQTQVLDRNLLEERVRKLEEALGRTQSDNRVVANIFAGPGLSPYDTLVIDAGSEHGISVGDMVVYAGAGAVGEIVEISDLSSKVKLFSSPGDEHLVMVGEHYISARASGKGMGNFEAKVPQDSIVAIGDNVVSLKGDLILGKVTLIEEKPAEPFKRLFFRVPFNISEIRTVEVVIGKHQ